MNLLFVGFRRIKENRHLAVVAPHTLKEVNARTVGEVIFDELDRIKRERVPEAELARAKAIYEGSLARNFETVLSLASIIGIEELLYRIEPFPESVARIRAVDAEEVQRIAAETLAPEQFAIAVVGRRPSDVRGPA